jgi:hypothetical protein
MITVIVFKFFDIIFNICMPLGAENCACFTTPENGEENPEGAQKEGVTTFGQKSAAKHEPVSQIERTGGDNQV